MRYGFRFLITATIALACAACSAGPTDYPPASPPTAELITVGTMDLRPTVSMDATVVA